MDYIPRHCRHGSTVFSHESQTALALPRPRCSRSLISSHLSLFAFVNLTPHFPLTLISPQSPLTTPSTIMTKQGDYEAVRKDIAKLLHQPEYDDGSAGPVLVRLAW